MERPANRNRNAASLTEPRRPRSHRGTTVRGTGGDPDGTIPATLGGHLRFLHGRLATTAPDVDRIACALHDAATGTLRTFVNSTRRGYAIRGYEYPLALSHSLSTLAATGAPRVLDDLPAVLDAGTEHSRYVLDEGYRSSYTVPIYAGGRFLGVVFFDSRRHGTFTLALQRELGLYAQIIAAGVAAELAAARSLVGSIHVARDVAELRDVETGAHLERVARYARLVAQALVEPLDRTDEWVEAVFLYAPMHDIGKVGIPDRILLKPGALDPEEWAVMRTHPLKGRDLVDTISADLGLVGVTHDAVLRNIVELHHELLDGSGYPHGLRGDEIPLEARVLTVADVYDALTTDRPYKRAWTHAAALDELERMAERGRLDERCVAVVRERADAFREVGERNPDGAVHPPLSAA